MSSDHTRRNGQPKPRATSISISRMLKPYEALQRTLDVFSCYAGIWIADLNQAIGFAPYACPTAISNRISNQVLERTTPSMAKP